MNDYIYGLKQFVRDNQKSLKSGVVALLGIGVVVGFVALFAYNSQSKLPNIVYQPTAACKLFTKTEAQELLGKQVIERASEPTIAGNSATSKCSYTDTNQDNFTLAAVAARNGINDEGVQKNNEEFAASREANTTETVTGLGDQAFFNKANGQLNILSGRTWLILSFGSANDPQANTLDNAMRLAYKVLETQQLVSGNQVTF